MSYQYDIFLSYRRSRLHDAWLSESFVPLFWDIVREEITEKTGRTPAGIFFDQTELTEEARKFDQYGIEPGENWQTKLKEAIKASRCMVALWSPLYFHSEWCLIEWKSFLKRPSSTGLPDLLVPISVHDGESFPDEARAAQIVKFVDFVFVGAGFTKTELYIDFQRQLRILAARVAKVVAHAPPWEDWSLSETVSTPGEIVIKQQKL